MKGTLLNATLVALGALVGLAGGGMIPAGFKDVVVVGIGLCNVLFAVKMFLEGDDILLTVAAVALGGLLGTALGLTAGLHAFAETVRSALGGGGRFNEALITTSVLYCVGPMTVLGCIRDGLEGDIELLKLKSVLDGATAVFFAAALGPGVLVTAAVVLVFQGALTLAARPLEPLTRVPGVVKEMGSVGGVLMLAIGLGLAGVKAFPSEVFLPALVLAPVFVVVKAKVSSLRPAAP